jgi:hypothetical protein
MHDVGKFYGPGFQSCWRVIGAESESSLESLRSESVSSRESFICLCPSKMLGCRCRNARQFAEGNTVMSSFSDVKHVNAQSHMPQSGRNSGVTDQLGALWQI